MKVYGSASITAAPRIVTATKRLSHSQVFSPRRNGEYLLANRFDDRRLPTSPIAPMPRRPLSYRPGVARWRVVDGRAIRITD